MSATCKPATGKRDGKYRRRTYNGKYSFDYVHLSLEDFEINPSPNGPETHKTQDDGKNAWRKEFAEKLKFSILNKEIRERLKTTEKAQLDWLTPCFRTLCDEPNFSMLRRCFCESIGPKFCEICRRKVNKDLSNRVPRMICDLRNSDNDVSMLERAEYFVTPEPKFSRHLKQATSFHRGGGNNSSQEDRTSPYTGDDQYLSTKNFRHVTSRASSYSSLSSNKSEDLKSEEVPQNSPNVSPVIHELPILNTPTGSFVKPDHQLVLTSSNINLPPLVPAIKSDVHIHDDTVQSPVIPVIDEHILADIPQIPEPTPTESDITYDSKIFHITHELRSIQELKAESCSLNNTESQHVLPVIPQQPSNKFDDKENSSPNVLFISQSDESSRSLKTNTKQTPCTVLCDKNNALPKLPHPVEPVLLELKYINFSIYDYDCELDK